MFLPFSDCAYLNLSKVDGQGPMDAKTLYRCCKYMALLACSVCQMNVAEGECLGLATGPLNPALAGNGFKMRPKHPCLGHLWAESAAPVRTALAP